MMHSGTVPSQQEARQAVGFGVRDIGPVLNAEVVLFAVRDWQVQRICHEDCEDPTGDNKSLEFLGRNSAPLVVRVHDGKVALKRDCDQRKDGRVAACPGQVPAGNENAEIVTRGALWVFESVAEYKARGDESGKHHVGHSKVHQQVIHRRLHRSRTNN